MSQVRLASITPVRFAQFAVALVAAIAMTAVMAAPSFAGKKSESCTVVSCITVIDVGDVDIKIEGNRLLTDNEVTIIEDSFNETLNNNTICVQLGLVNQCKSAIEVEILNDLKAFVPIFVGKVDVL